MCCGADMPNLLERMPLGGGEPGCREAAMDPPQLKLFGQTISVASTHTGAGADAEVLKPTSASPPWDTAPSSRQDWTEKKGVVETHISARSSSGDGYSQPPKFSKLGTTDLGSRLSEDSSEGGRSDELKEQSEGDHSHSDKGLPKPDKVMACPRCDSLDTKFCYYNNYNVNQPRHFCKNCQRYWTAGGTLRNVPVGAGRRKNKHGGGLQRDNCSESSGSPLFSGPLGSPTSQKGTSFKQSQSKRMAGQSSPMRSPGSASSFGQESGITMSSPSYSLHQNGRLPFQAYACSQGFMTSGTEASVVGSSDSASTLHPRLQRFPSGTGFDKDCSRSSLSGLMENASILGPIQTAFTAPMSQQEAYRPVASSDMTSGWAGTDAPGRFFNGDYPNGYHLEWNGKQHPSQAHRAYNPSWSPAPQWASNVGYVSHPQGWSGPQPSGLCISSPGQEQQLVALHSTLGKRGASDGGRMDGASDSSQSSAKALRTDEFSRSLKSTWPMLGRNPSDVNATLKLFQPKLELAGACEQKDSFMGRLFISSAAARPGPSPVTI